MTRKDKIIEILNDRSIYEADNWINLVADAILAIPMDVPTDKEIDDYAFDIKRQKDKNAFDAYYAEAFIYGVEWAIEQVKERNK